MPSQLLQKELDLTGGPITLEDIESVKTYRSVLNRELIRRQAGKYSQAWHAKRLSVCIRTLQRYIELGEIQSQQILNVAEVTFANVQQIPTNIQARRAGIMVQHCYLQDATGKRYPPLPAVARKLLRKGILVQWVRRGWNVYVLCGALGNSQIRVAFELVHQFIETI